MDRTFILKTPHMRGDDVAEFQDDLNARYKDWEINKQIVKDDDYGAATHEAAIEVCTGLGIDAATAMAHGVDPDLRLKIRHPERRTPQEVAADKGAAATQMRDSLRKKCAEAAHGVVTFDGVQVAAWIVPSLEWARAHGWTGKVVSGYRDCAHQTTVAAVFAASKGLTVAQEYPNGPCASNHVGYEYPRGAVDVSEYQQLNTVLQHNPTKPGLVWAGPVIGDVVHFSATGH
jgi:hypothetical protein